MGLQTVADLGELGTVGGILRPLDLTLQRDGAVWNLTGYTSPQLRIWDVRTHTVVAVTGTLAVQDAANGVVRYSPAVNDPIQAKAGTFEGRCWLNPAGGGDPEPSGLFRFTIGGGPGPT